jgi:hypothetical protein
MIGIHEENKGLKILYEPVFDDHRKIQDRTICLEKLDNNQYLISEEQYNIIF